MAIDLLAEMWISM